MDTPDLSALHDRLLAGAATAREETERCLAAARSAPAKRAFVLIDDEAALAAAQDADQALREGREPGALAGACVSVKDLFDVAGQRTRAGSTWLGAAGPAPGDASAVSRLRRAGAGLIGRTQMTEFAFSGVGINPHDGTPANVAMAALGFADRVPGGSSSGAAASVACGAAWAGLGSDTGGSIRIPAALHGLVGFKNTQALTPIDGAVPLAPSLDTACAITRSVRDAIRVHEVLAARKVALAGRPLSAARLGWIEPLFLDGIESPVSRAFDRSLAALSGNGATVRQIDLPALAELPELTDGGGITAAQAWAWHAPHLEAHAAEYDPRVLGRIRRGSAISPDRLATLHALRRAWIDRVCKEMTDVDVVLSPTVPVLAPALAPLLEDDDAFFRVNALLLRNPMVVNLLDGCAISLPCQPVDAPPVGLMLWAPGGRDDLLLDVALGVERALRGTRGE